MISLVRSVAVFAALGAFALGAATLTLRAENAFATSGPGGGDDDEPDDLDDFDSSGPGSGDDDDFDSSGPGSGHDDDDDFDSSGPGSGGDDGDDNSGPGSNDDDEPARPDDDAFDHTIAEAVDANYEVAHDDLGHEYILGEVLLMGSRGDLRIAIARGFREVRVERLTSGGVLALLIIPARLDVDEAVAWLASAAPNAVVTPNNLYRGAQSLDASNASRAHDRPARLSGTIGIIDTGVDASRLPVRGALLQQRAFAAPRPIARDHGSMVASIAVARGARVYVADVFGQSADGTLAASAERLAAAIDWMISRRAPVINISVEGPDNAVLHEMVRRAAQRGHIIVAAAGNGGPNASPSFPAAFDGVLAVTAIDETGRPYVRASRGEYIDFAAHGVDVNVAMGSSTVRVSGTSFAAPLIAAEAAAHLHLPSPAASARALAALQARAEDLGDPGRDRIFGWGALRN